MKKFISGIIIGGLIFGAVPALASSGLVGQKVQGIFSIEKSGNKIAEAVVINGSAYAPVRALAEATGTKLTVEGKKIIMGNLSSSVMIDGVEYDLKIKITGEINTLKENIAWYEFNIKGTQENEIKPAEENLVKAKISDNGTPESALVISSIEQRIKESKAHIAEQQKLIDQAKADIEKLQTQIKDLEGTSKK
ncbi:MULTISPECIES: hypothetical protein [Paenibacillus]|uniref:Copper amine oxidase-like N-terminal domain-containing protein n=1 Tax=Paenibacillus odorifer TaxID=189426 RepID=A0AB36J6Z5_9BACL|nr:hypothetical protein [Paenibacillus odorifer]OMD21346.1 hypothetical protein BJP48_30215 [Paenibacillus odorifer]OME05986.1 hypothetical protein BSK60_32940 [Paenibacillus odorifer]OME10527.1 hypothetical protein BSK47_30445 [Paenibacillus odorifer]